MKTFIFLLLQFSLLSAASGAFAQDPKITSAPPSAIKTEKSVKLPEVREELLRRAKITRELRTELFKNNGRFSADEAAQVMSIDQENVAYIKSAIEKYGWLGTSLVGEDGEDAAFRIVKAASQESAFQKQYLELLQKAVKDGEAPATQPALLIEQMQMIAGKISALPPGASIQNTGGIQTTNAQTPSTIKYPALREELIKRMADDQRVRRELLKKYNGAFTPAAEEMKKIDDENTAWIKPLIKQYGWLGNNSVGADGATAAFLIVQHTQDDEFRKSTLELLRKAYQDGEARGDQLALMTDRVLMREGKPQIYGTQPMRGKDGKLEVPLLEDAANVDKRRAETGLGPLAEYIERMRQSEEKTKPVN